MYHLFRRFEWLAFSIVTASAVACAGYIAAERLGVSLQDFTAPHGANAAIAYVMACEDAGPTPTCEQMLANWKGAQ
jgi:hypothetical protein